MKINQVKDLKEDDTSALRLPEVLTAEPDDKALTALQRMKKNRIHHLAVVVSGQLVGMVSDRDIIDSALCVGVGGELSWLTVERAMRKDVPEISSASDASDILKLMVEGGFSALPVVEDGRLKGIVTETDLLRLSVQLLEADPIPRPLSMYPYLTSPVTQKVMSMLSDIGI